ncbi:TetR/AcrR family transcriptional regulator [Aliiroseovarius crassostreae]|uniref:TetR/AcrR family transcriptional regulator n=1 Tax=Aliiroseovarius crassostreae TaxID=154981 RepID=UPI00220C1939|nr:TetR/AcrR family transcriptional regulator [Aliiroseovarius crassostreae]UWQ08202.1 TetR/AcrR family transcriptional regulator [Aliiroseovarius crassostreae]
MTEKRNRLSSEDWIMAGFRALARQGAKALKAEPLARELGTTKGSFYWHFKDLSDFHTQMLLLWEHRAVDAITDGLATEPDPVRRLYLLGEIATANDATHGGDSTEPAIRAWALDHPDVAQAVARVDQKRLGYLKEILVELDLTNPDFARIIYGAYIGLGTLSATDEVDNRNAMSTLLAALLALRDA